MESFVNCLVLREKKEKEKGSERRGNEEECEAEKGKFKKGTKTPNYGMRRSVPSIENL